MTVVGIAMVRDEEDILEPVLRHLLAEGVDHLLVSNNLSEDGTEGIIWGLEEETARVTLLTDDEPGYFQSRKMSALARQAHDLGADWVLPFDADEVWYAPTSTIGEALAGLPEDVSVVKAPGWDHLVTDPGYWAEQFGPFSPYRREQTQPMVKVAFRAHPAPEIAMGNHSVTLPGDQGREIHGTLAFRHFQYRSFAQMTRKLRQGRAAYEATDINPDQGLHWRAGGLKTDEELARDWAMLCAEEGLVFDPAPLRVTVA